jgi:hypothetical protein
MQSMKSVVEKVLWVYLALGPAPLTALNGVLVGWSDGRLMEVLTSPTSCRACPWEGLGPQCWRVGSVIGAALLSEDVVEETSGGATTLAIERGLGAGGRRHDICWLLGVG